MFRDGFRFTLIVSAIALSGCATFTDAATPANTCGAAPDQAAIDDAVKTYMDAINWKDPESVHVRNTTLGPCLNIPHGLAVKEPIPAGWAIFFEVNAKNSYGGYTGFQVKRVILTSDGKIHYDAGGT